MFSEPDERKYTFPDIPASKDWKTVELITKGWSVDQKYRLTVYSGESLLLRLSDVKLYEAKRKEYEIITRYAALGINMSRPVEFGICDHGEKVYMLLTWVEGRDLKDVLPALPERQQYLLGRQAGRILKKIHSIPLEKEDLPQTTKREKKLFQLSQYENSRVRIPGDEIAVSYVKNHIDCIWREKPVYQHGDFHPGNLICTPDGSIGVIDFNRWEVGDPYEEFYKLQSFGTEVSVPYCIGQIDAYFESEGSIPESFWTANAVYVAHASLNSIKWAEKFGQAEIDGMVRRARNTFRDYDDFRLTVPKWYTDADRAVPED